MQMAAWSDTRGQKVTLVRGPDTRATTRGHRGHAEKNWTSEDVSLTVTSRWKMEERAEMTHSTKDNLLMLTRLFSIDYNLFHL